MEKTLFEQMGGTYRQVGDYFLPNLELPDEPEVEIGVWGERRRMYKSLQSFILPLSFFIQLGVPGQIVLSYNGQ